MSRETEKVMKQFAKFMEEHADAEDADFDALAAQFMGAYNAGINSGTASTGPETADDYLDLANEATSDKKRREYLQKALELDPDNLDAEMALLAITSSHVHELLDGLSKMIAKADVRLENEGYFKDDMGHFWGVIETRPYMRVRYEYMNTLVNCGMISKAISECERMIELCENDNLGIRLRLMHLYAFMEQEESALKLWRKFDETEDTQMLLPLAILYYKLGRLDESTKYLKMIAKENKNAKSLIGNISRHGLGQYLNDRVPDGYTIGSLEELVIELNENVFLFTSVPHFFKWADKAIRR